MEFMYVIMGICSNLLHTVPTGGGGVISFINVPDNN